MKRRLIVGSLALLATAVSLEAQETAYRFNISTPGARSLGMGGAFLALADDATAAYTNPAGLSNLTVGGPEVAMEARSWSYSTEFVQGGRVPELGSPTYRGIDSDDEPVHNSSEESLTGLSFLSVAYVFPRGLTCALYRHQLAEFRSAYETQGFFVDFPGLFSTRFPPRQQAVDLSIESYGSSAAYRFDFGGDRSLALGLGVSRYEAELSLAVGEFLVEPPLAPLDDDPLYELPGGFYGPAVYHFDRLLSGTFIEDRGTDYGINLGALARFGTAGRWSVGAVYREGPRFELTQQHFSRSQGWEPDSKVSLRVPDVYGLGIAHSFANGKTRVAVDYDKVRYSQRFDDLFPEEASREGFQLQDAAEIHLGAEHIFLVIDSLFVGTARAGVFQETGHELEYVGREASTRALYPETKDDLHWAAGLGLVIKEDYQIDLAADFSDRVDTISLSLVKFF